MRAWTKTYDVLKWPNDTILNTVLFTWTKTYDVLKCVWTLSVFSYFKLEPKHMMYWNALKLSILCSSSILEPKHMMYWNPSSSDFKITSVPPLNQNIWCIEIVSIYWMRNMTYILNQNIWCIEIFDNKIHYTLLYLLNQKI